MEGLEIRFDILNRLGVDHKCNGQTDGQTARETEWPLSIARSNIVRRALKWPGL